MMKSNENNGAVTKSFAKKMESISPFELKNKLIEMADESIKKIRKKTELPPALRLSSRPTTASRGQSC